MPTAADAAASGSAWSQDARTEVLPASRQGVTPAASVPASAATSRVVGETGASAAPATPARALPRRRMSPVVPVFGTLMVLIAAAVLGGIYMLPKVLKGASTNQGAPVAIPTGSPSQTPTVTPSASPTTAAPTTAAPTTAAPTTAAPTTAAPTTPAGDPALTADCQRVGATGKDLPTCLAAWGFMKRYAPLEQGKTLQQADVANWWTDPAYYYGTRESLAKIYPQIVAPSEAGTVYQLGTISDFSTNVNVPGGRGKGVEVDMEVPFTQGGQAKTVTVQYFLVPGTGANPYRIASVDEA